MRGIERITIVLYPCLCPGWSRRNDDEVRAAAVDQRNYSEQTSRHRKFHAGPGREPPDSCDVKRCNNPMIESIRTKIPFPG